MARILLIEDDDSVRTVVGLILTKAGHTVILARDGQEGLDLFPETAADLVITDMVMPRKSGLEVMQALRVTPFPVKIIAISGGGPPGEVHPLDAAQRLGADRVIDKPFSQTTLMEVINDVLSGGIADTVDG